MKIKILIPVYNDWQSVFKLLDEIDHNISEIDHEISVTIVNDASNHDRDNENRNYQNNSKEVRLSKSFNYLMVCMIIP